MSRRPRDRRPPGSRREPRDSGPSWYVDDAKLIELSPLIHRIATGRGVAERFIPDLVQEVLFQAWHAMISGRFRVLAGRDVDTALRSWVVAIAFNQVMNWQARASTRREIPFANPLRFDLGGSEDPWPRYEARSVMRWAAERLPPHLQAVLLLGIRGLSPTEIAVLLDIPPWTVRTRLAEIRKRLTAIA